MQLTFDPGKNGKNIQERGLAFTLVSEMDWATASLAKTNVKTMANDALGYWAALTVGCMPLYLRPALTSFT